MAIVISISNTYFNFFWYPESLKVYFRIVDPKQIGTSTLQMKYIFSDTGKQSYLIDDVFIFEFWLNTPIVQKVADELTAHVPKPKLDRKDAEELNTTLSDDLNMCTQKIVVPVDEFVPKPYENIPYTLNNGGRAKAFQPEHLYVDGTETQFHSVVIKAGETRSILAMFSTMPLDKQKYNTVIICPTIRFFDSLGRPLVAMCRGWNSTYYHQNNGTGEYFLLGGPATLLPSPISCSVDRDIGG
jgi:hypothetical protein